MIKNKYSVCFDMDEAKAPVPCGSCHFNTSIDEVIVCIAKSCKTQPTVKQEQQDDNEDEWGIKDMTGSSEPLTHAELMKEYTMCREPLESLIEFCARMHYTVM